jgi:hypothetical protein
MIRSNYYTYKARCQTLLTTAKKSSPESPDSDDTKVPAPTPATQEAPQLNPALEKVQTVEEIVGLDASSLKVQADQSQKKIDSLPPSTVDEIVRQYASKSTTTPGLAIIGIAALCQSGGSNAGNPSLKRTINGIVFDLTTLREVVKYVTSNKGTVRQLAKSMRNVIAKISIANDWPGPLATALVKEFPELEFNSTDLIYAAEYHDDNRQPEFPPNVAKALAIREAKGREARRSASKPAPKGKKSKNKKGK